MKIGVFDSGLGGLVITRSFINTLPEYDYVYYGDTKHLPYGEKTSGRILNYTLEAVKFLIAQDCALIIIACNTATSIALRYIQQRFIPVYAPSVKVLGVVIPTVEKALETHAAGVGVIATNATVRIFTVLSCIKYALNLPCGKLPRRSWCLLLKETTLPRPSGWQKNMPRSLTLLTA